MSPVITVYASNETTVLGSSSGSGKYGATLTVTVNSSVTAGEQFYIKIHRHRLARSTAAPRAAMPWRSTWATGTMPAVTIPNAPSCSTATRREDISGGLDELAPIDVGDPAGCWPARLNAAPAYLRRSSRLPTTPVQGGGV